MAAEVMTDSQNLMDQAPPTVKFYLRQAVLSIDDVLGEGFAKKHPELIIAVLTATGEDFRTAHNKAGMQDIGDGLCAIANAIRAIEFR